MTESKALAEAGHAPAPPAGTEEMSGLVRLALEKGHPVEVLERLVALQERVTEREARMAFIRALGAFQAGCPPILRTRANEQFQVTRSGIRRPARYAPLEEIDRTARPVAAALGICWTWDTRIEGDYMEVICRVLHAEGHSETATVRMPYESKAGASPQQKYGSTQTYGMRYSLVAALGITTADEDTDGNAPAGEPETITEAQAADLEALIGEVKADKARFLRWLGFSSLEEIPADDLPRAVKALEDKRKGAAK